MPYDFATLYAARRLPMVGNAEGDPERFRCERLHCTLTRAACGAAHIREARAAAHVRRANRLRLAGQTDGRGYKRTEHAIVYSPCADCEIGEANAQRTPLLTQEQASMTLNSESAQDTATPSPKGTKAARKRRRRRRKGRSAMVPPKAAPTKQRAPRAVPTLPRVGGKSAAEWLTLVGFRVNVIETPRGVFLEHA